ncbi:FG-GAP-like repeat-containing protein [Flavobacterium ajazii]|uniref:FG-GAP-like repeat-containing protein n=1 Tax=Flavobacterium ajazii TaxID=2692318 RepID=UPI0013CF46D3|nr:FG-GAP-like repeat-containing protein [Flavobacterium ajazii]
MKQFYALLLTFFSFLTSYSQTGAALDFDGANDYVALNSGTAIYDSFTIEAWIKPGDATKTMHIVSTRNNSDPGFDIQIKNGNTLHADIGNGGYWINTSADATYAYSVDVWFHLAYVITKTGYKIYANGNLVGSGTYSDYPLLLDGIREFRIGSDSTESTFFKGQMDEVRVWKRALTKCEIVNNMNSELSSGQKSLALYYKFNQGTASGTNTAVTSITDSSGNSNNGTLTNFNLSSNTSNLVSPGAVVSGSTSLAYSHIPLVVSSPQVFDANITVADLAATGTDIKWYSAEIGGTALAANTPIKTGIYYVSQTIGGCESDRTSVNVISNMVITDFSPSAAKPGDVVIITGANFNTTPVNNVVFFGATQATVTASTEGNLTVRVPTGATYGPITVLNTATTLACSSLSNFNPVYSPVKSTITTSDFAFNADFATGSNPRKTAIGDLDGDGKPDLVVVNYDSNTISIYHNESTSGNLGSGSFAPKINLITGDKPSSVTIGDLDGDGKPDLVIAAISSVSVFRNVTTNGSITVNSFESRIDIDTGKDYEAIAIGDLNGDGKPDLAAPSYFAGSIYLFSNTSSIGIISFAAKFEIVTSPYLSSMTICDFDGDGKPDLLTAYPASFNQSGGFYIYRNTATVGSFTNSSFAPRVEIGKGNYSPQSLKIGDLDGDGKPDLVFRNSKYISILRNAITNGSITSSSFEPKVDIAATNFINFSDVAIGDIDGDGKPDLVATEVGVKIAHLLRNTATIGSFNTDSFAPKVTLTTTYNHSSVAIGDLDGDGKPDLIMSSSESNTISIFRNTNNNSNLSTLTTTAGIISPAFATGTTAYTATVSNISDITITPTVEDLFATVQVQVNGNGYNTVISGSASGSLTLAEGLNTIEIKVTAQNAETKTYTLKINRIVTVLDNVGLSNTTLATTAYSLRKLASTYSGYAIKVRRSSDNTLLDIGFNTNGELDTDALKTFTGNSSGFVTKWYDQSGNENHVEQTNINLQPRIVNGGIIEVLNKRPALYFGTAHLATAKTTLFDTAASMVGFAKGNSSTPSSLVTKTGTSVDTNTHYPAPFDFTNNGGEFYTGNASITSGSSVNIANSSTRSDISISVPASVYSFVIPSSGTYYSYMNGVQSSSNTISAYADNGNALQIGNRNDGGGSGNFWTTELILFNSVLSTVDRQTVEESQKNYYNNNNASLTALTISDGIFSPGFSSSVTNYTASVSNQTNTITVTPTLENTLASAKLQLNGAGYIAIASGTASDVLDLNVGSNTIEVKVTAQNGEEKIYTLTIYRKAVPTFAAIDPICSGNNFTLPTISNNGITGTWSPAVNTTTTTLYTFTPANSATAETVAITVSIVQSSDNITQISACGSYTWNNQTYTQSGIYTGTTNNCVTEKLDLTITPNSDNVTQITACGSYTWNNQTYTQSGIYTGVTNNCVTEKLDLTITPNSDNITQITACGSYTWNNQTYTQSGIYTGTTNNCVTEKLDLTITAIPVNILTTVNQNNGVLTADQSGIGYQWLNCDGTEITGETNQFFTPTTSGQYAVRLIVACSVPIISDCVTITSLKTDDFEARSSIKIYPNPSTGIFYLQPPSDKQLEIYNSLGQLLITKKVNSGTNKIDISDKADGVYFVKIIENGNTSNFKVIKKH